MPDRLIIVRQRAVGNSTLNVYCDGLLVGTVLEQPGGRWDAKRGSEPPGHASLDDAVRWLVAEHDRQRGGDGG